MKQTPDPQKLSLKLFPDCKRMFGDAGQLGGCHAWHYAGNAVSYIPSAHVFVAGCPCADASRRNMHSARAANRGCIANGDLRTGNSFRGLLGFVKVNSPGEMLHLMLENVLALATPAHRMLNRNLDHACDLLNGIGWQVVVFKLCPSLVGVPQHRDSLWFSGFPGSS